MVEYNKLTKREKDKFHKNMKERLMYLFNRYDPDDNEYTLDKKGVLYLKINSDKREDSLGHTHIPIGKIRYFNNGKIVFYKKDDKSTIDKKNYFYGSISKFIFNKVDVVIIECNNKRYRLCPKRFKKIMNNRIDHLLESRGAFEEKYHINKKYWQVEYLDSYNPSKDENQEL